MNPVVELVNIGKRFGAVTSLDGVSLKLYPGEVLGLLGDNGAGKSTLIKILSGFYAPTRGEIKIDGNAVDLESPRTARQLGIETVYQDFGLVESLSIARNFFLGIEPVQWGFWLKHNEMKRVASEALRETGIKKLDPNSPVGRLSGGERQAIAIGRAWHFGRRVLILDEPTSALSIQETEHVFRNIREARAKGMSVVIITHNLFHAESVCDRYIVLRHGKLVAELPGTTSRDILERLITQGPQGQHDSH